MLTKCNFRYYYSCPRYYYSCILAQRKQIKFHTKNKLIMVFFCGLFFQLWNKSLILFLISRPFFNCYISLYIFFINPNISFLHIYNFALFKCDYIMLYKYEKWLKSIVSFFFLFFYSFSWNFEILQCAIVNCRVWCAYRSFYKSIQKLWNYTLDKCVWRF